MKNIYKFIDPILKIIHQYANIIISLKNSKISCQSNAEINCKSIRKRYIMDILDIV